MQVGDQAKARLLLEPFQRDQRARVSPKPNRAHAVRTSAQKEEQAQPEFQIFHRREDVPQMPVSGMEHRAPVLADSPVPGKNPRPQSGPLRGSARLLPRQNRNLSASCCSWSHSDLYSDEPSAPSAQGFLIRPLDSHFGQVSPLRS